MTNDSDDQGADILLSAMQDAGSSSSGGDGSQQSAQNAPSQANDPGPANFVAINAAPAANPALVNPAPINPAPTNLAPAQPATAIPGPTNLAPVNPAPYQPPANTAYGQLPVINLRAGDPQPGSVISADQHWTAGRPLATPLAFQIPSDPPLGSETRTLNHLAVDFTSTQSVKFANHYTAQVIGRARQRLGIPYTRPTTQGPYTDPNRDFIMFAHED